MLAPGQRRMVIKGVAFGQNVREALGTIVPQSSTDPPVYLVELLFSLNGVQRVEVAHPPR